MNVHPPRRSAPVGSAGPVRGELGWIGWIQERTHHPEGAPWPALELGIGDDCAILRPVPGEDLVVTTDFTLEGRHFRRDWHSAESAGHRTLARGLSDIAAMGARPLAAFLSLAFPASKEPGHIAWTEGFLNGLLTLADHWGIPLAGGDTSESPSEHLLADITLLGATPHGTALRRSGARPGDRLFVTGSLGGAAAELQTLRRRAEALEASSASAVTGSGEAPATPPAAHGSEEHPQLFPQPRLSVGQFLRAQTLATACMDLSDGLSSDLAHLCDASGVAAVVELGAIPASAWIHQLPPAEREAAVLHGGEDYELLFTAAPGVVLPAFLEGVPLTCIGDIVPRAPEDATVRLRRDGREEALEPAGWEHLRG